MVTVPAGIVSNAMLSLSLDAVMTSARRFAVC